MFAAACRLKFPHATGYSDLAQVRLSHRFPVIHSLNHVTLPCTPSNALDPKFPTKLWTLTLFIPSLQAHNNSLSKKLLQAQEHINELYSRRKEDSKANARVVEMFASHRHTWQQEEKRMLCQINDNVEEIASLKAKVEDLEIMVYGLKKEVSGGVVGDYYMKRGFHNVDDGHNMFDHLEVSESRVSKFLAERSNLWQGVQYESVEPVHDFKHCVTRRESPWKVDGDSSGVSAKLKLLEQELQNLENISANDLSKVPSSMKKQAKRYQALGKIDDLCRRMQENDPCEPNASSEFRTRRQTEFLLEALRLQQRASETVQKWIALQTETGTGRARLASRLSLSSIRNNFRDIQRNLEIWLARIIRDAEEILASDGKHGLVVDTLYFIFDFTA
ncbi:uncharacterized protein LOC143556270 [Bidens hawaiensis]|uniref:uncharacterized protein LOC143556270 n=1 Tax=Bidens hawaiensis TaxID=980011 RepID=UPI00404B2A4C